MGVFDHQPTTACGYPPGQSQFCHIPAMHDWHTYCLWCHDRWPCDVAMIRSDIARELLAQPVLADYWKAARVIAPWLPEFDQNNS